MLSFDCVYGSSCWALPVANGICYSWVRICAVGEGLQNDTITLPSDRIAFTYMARFFDGVVPRFVPFSVANPDDLISTYSWIRGGYLQMEPP